MRIFRGLENVHSIIDQHEAEWRKENGEEPLQPTPRVRTRTLERKVVERYSEALSPEPEKAKLNPERFSQSAEPQVKAVNVIEQGDSEHHSWLYKEVMKAINDAAAGNKNVKIVAVFVPVIQNSKEFDNLPADETVTISSAINEDDVHPVKPETSEPAINTANIVEDLIPPTHIESDSELTEAFMTIEENLNSEAEPEQEPDRSALMMEAPDDSEGEGESESEESGALPDEPVELAELAAAEPVEPEKPEVVELVVEEPEEPPETLAFEEIKEEPSEESEELELPDIPELETNPDEQPIELEAEISEALAEVVELVDGSDEPEESGELDEPVDSLEPTESGELAELEPLKSEPEANPETASESEAESESESKETEPMTFDEIQEEPESEPPAEAPVEEVTEEITEEITEPEDGKESPEEPEEGFPLPEDPETDTIVLEPSEESIGNSDDEPEGNEDNTKPESESDAESDEEHEDFGEIEII
ncbi:MAG: hypothetical protein IJQ56_09025 [Synergistaceae bacterium]|nr:hypothetical protein [Synergistaceae bacterium]